MATLVDSLVVSLGLDASAFEKGSRQTEASLRTTSETAARTAKQMQADGAKAAEFFSNIKNEALSLIGVLLGGKGLESFIKDQTKALSDLGRQAINIGESVPDLAAFSNAIERNGGSAQSARDSMLGYANAIERFKVFGDATVLQFLNPIGASVQDSPLQAYMKFVKYVEEHKNTSGGAQLINLIGHGLGYDQGLINATIQMGSVAKVNAELARSRELGVPTQDMVDRVTALQASFIALEQAAVNLGNVMLASNAGWMRTFNEWLTYEIVNNPHVVEGIVAITTAFGGLLAVRLSASTLGLTGVATALDKILLLILRVSGGLAALALTGPAGGQATEDETSDVTKSLQQSGALGDPNSGVSGWLRSHLPSWLTGAGLTPADPDAVRRSLGEGGLGIGLGGSVTGGSRLSHEEFLRQAGPLAERAGAATGVDPRLILAQAALESRWGQSAPGNNYFGIKGAGPRLGTQEFINGRMVSTSASFAGYGSMEESFEGYANFIKNNPRYAAMLNARGLPAQLDALGRSGYATDPDYAAKLSGIIGSMPASTLGRSRSAAPTLDPNLIPPRGGPRVGSNDNSTDVDIGTLNVHTQATDADGISKAINRSLTDAITVQANRGPQ